jgi:hypothetical protein
MTIFHKIFVHNNNVPRPAQSKGGGGWKTGFSNARRAGGLSNLKEIEGQVRLVRLQTNNFRLHDGQTVNGLKENRLGFRFLFEMAAHIFLYIYRYRYIYILFIYIYVYIYIYLIYFRFCVCIYLYI